MKRLLLILLIGLGLLLLYIIAPALMINPGRLKTHAPGQTAMMKLRLAEAAQQGKILKIDQRWAPLNRISQQLQDAVRVSEDAAFFSHGGVDWDEAKEALNYNLKKKRFARGASTITMQLARNLYLSPSKNPLRKLQEVLITYRLELTLPKARIFEIYLNIAEWGDGIFGVEAAAQRYFHKSAAALDPEEAARLAAVLPNPRHWNPTSQQQVVLRRKELILKRMSSRGN